MIRYVCVCLTFTTVQSSKSFFGLRYIKKIKWFEDHDKCSRQIVQRIIQYDSCVFKCHARPNFSICIDKFN
jgi:hypothetical protein